MITQFVLKAHGRCDLSCRHCYVFEHADQSWRGKPRAISLGTTRKAAERIAEHAAEAGLAEVDVLIHGGEPLLLGHAGMREFLMVLSTVLSPVVRPLFHLQTNGVRLDAEFCALFAEFGVSVGVSLDGDRAANDRYRLFTDGRSSHRQVHDALALLRARPELYDGILCTIDVRNDPIAVYEALLAQEPPAIDLLLPHATWENPPYRPAGSATPYADWLTAFHTRWTEDDRPFPIRLFDSLASLARGGPSFTEALGNGPTVVLTVDTDGSWERPDSLKTAYDGAPGTGLNVRDHPVRAVTAKLRPAAPELSAECRACPVVSLCGGGLLAHRHRRSNGFANPSVYCADLKALITRTVPQSRVAGPPRPRTGIPPELVMALTGGAADHRVLRRLAQLQTSLAAALVGRTAGLPGGGPLGRAAVAGWDLLCELDRTHRRSVRKAFAHPYVAEWAVRCLVPPSGADRELDLAHLGGLAAVAAQSAGATAEVAVPVRDGALHLPGLGAFRTEAPDGTLLPVRVQAGALLAEGEWIAPHRHESRALSLTINDLDPFRGSSGVRLSPSALAVWDEKLSAAGELLDRLLPEHAALLPLIRVLTPVGSVGSTARHAFGAVTVPETDGPDETAAALLRGLRLMQSAVLRDLCDLSLPADPPVKLRWAGRDLPVETVLGEVHAELAVSELALAIFCDQGTAAAYMRFLRGRSLTRKGVSVLQDSGVLTQQGTEFVYAMSKYLSR